MSRGVRLPVAVLAVAGFLLSALSVTADEPTSQNPSKATPHQHDHGAPAATHDHAGGGPHAHQHPAPPEQYANAHAPAAVWTDAPTLSHGKEIYDSRCAVCHGARGDGKGPGAASLPVKPPDLTDRRMVAEMTDSYWFWRVSEGGTVEPFKSQGSTMPPWKEALSADERWAVIAYQHTFSGHRGPHVPAEHPEMAHGEHGHAAGHAHDAGQKEHTHDGGGTASPGETPQHPQH